MGPSATRRPLIDQIDGLLEREPSADEMVQLLLDAGWLPPEAATSRTEMLSGVLRDGRRVPVRVQHSLLTGVRSGSI